MLMLDESFMEAKTLLLALMREQQPYEIVSHRLETGQERVLAIGNLSLSDASLTINSLRGKAKGAVLIHSYLPDFLIRHEPEAFLRLLEAWQNSIIDNGTVEFFLLPKNAFQDVEKKLMSIVDGVIEIKVNRADGGFGLGFTPMRCCRPEWHLHEFRYKFEGNRVLIEWGGEYIECIPGMSAEEIRSRAEYYKQNLQFLKVGEGITRPVGLSTHDYWLLSQIEGKDLFSLQILFYEVLDELLKKIAKWNIMGYLRVIKEKQKIVDESEFHLGKPLSLKTKLGLKLPSGLTLRFLNPGHLHSVPADVYMGEKKALFEFLRILFRDDPKRGAESLDSLLNLQEKFHEMVGRQTSVEHVQKMGQDVTASIDIKYLTKIVKMVLWRGYKLNCDIKQTSQQRLLLTVHDCFLCEGIKSVIPVCRGISGSLAGACSLTFKRMISCKEIKCKALGDDQCVFELNVAKSVTFPKSHPNDLRKALTKLLGNKAP